MAKETSDDVATIAAKYVKISNDDLFKLFYDALPKTSERFDELVNDIQSLAGSCLSQKEIEL